ncbi:MAG: hypothetical protein OK438_07870 [Thaumarchaeota archaeon]|nr:hypothetical protein [Nitrososphaerota archaeon]
MKVIFDTSFLMAVVERPTTWFEDMTEILGKFEPVLLDCVRGELGLLSRRQGRKARYASVALTLSDAFKSQSCGEASVDDEIISAAVTNDSPVATIDKRLGRILKAQHVKVIGLSSGRVTVR